MFGIPYRQAQMRKPIENAIHTFAVPAVATWALALKHRRVPRSVFGLKFDHGVSRFRFVSSQVGRIGVAPIRNIYNPRYLNSPPSRLGGRLHNVQSLPVEKESVIPEQFVQPR